MLSPNRLFPQLVWGSTAYSLQICVGLAYPAKMKINLNDFRADTSTYGMISTISYPLTQCPVPTVMLSAWLLHLPPNNFSFRTTSQHLITNSRQQPEKLCNIFFTTSLRILTIALSSPDYLKLQDPNHSN